jgi:uncharacterized protein
VKIFKGKKQILNNVHEAKGLLERLAGLLGKSAIPKGYAMYFPSCNSIHTCFMKIPIDVIMLDINGRVVFMRGDLRPWKTAVCLLAKDTIEMNAGSIAGLKIEMNDLLTIKRGS